MKKIFLLTAVLLQALSLVSCHDDDSSTTPTDRNGNDTSGLLVDIKSSAFISPDSLKDKMYSDVMGGSFSFTTDERRRSMREYFSAVKSLLMSRVDKSANSLDSAFQAKIGLDAQGNRRWQVESWAFNYRSKSARGEDVVLSGRVTFPNAMAEGVGHEVQSLTLFMHHALPLVSAMPSEAISMWTIRALLNSAVIEPDGQGCGTNLDADYYCATSPKVLARQMADCALAALELMKSRGVMLADDGHTVNVGCSLGAAVPLHFAKYYETEAPQSLRDALRLRSTFTGCGPLEWSSTLRYFSSHPRYNAMMSKTALISLAAFPASRLGGYDPHDFVSDDILKTTVEYEGRSMSYYEAEARYFFNVIGIRKELPSYTKLSQIMAPDMLTSDGKLNESSPKTQALFKHLEEEDNLSNWTPRHPVYLTHCRQDDGIPFEPAYQSYQEISRMGSNQNVHFSEKKLPAVLSAISSISGLAVIHGISTLIYIMPSYLTEDPGNE